MFHSKQPRTLRNNFLSAIPQWFENICNKKCRSHLLFCKALLTKKEIQTALTKILKKGKTYKERNIHFSIFLYFLFLKYFRIRIQILDRSDWKVKGGSGFTYVKRTFLYTVKYCGNSSAAVWLNQTKLDYEVFCKM